MKSLKTNGIMGTRWNASLPGRLAVMLALALVAPGAARAQDLAGANVRYRAGSAVSFDTSSTVKDEGGHWTLQNAQLGRLAGLQSGTATFADFTITATVTITNTPVDGQKLWLLGNPPRPVTWADTVTTASSQVQTGTNIAVSATNLYQQATNYLWPNLTATSMTATTVVLLGGTNQAVQFYVSGNWGRVTYSTNVTATATAMFSPAFSSPPTVIVTGNSNDAPWLSFVTNGYVRFGATDTNAVIRWMAIGAP